jgi:hypothetical protein
MVTINHCKRSFAYVFGKTNQKTLYLPSSPLAVKAAGFSIENPMWVLHKILANFAFG